MAYIGGHAKFSSLPGTAAVVGAAAIVLVAIAASTPVSAATPQTVPWQAERSHPTPGEPEDVLANYNILDAEFQSHPDLWGGAYVDGDYLVVKYLDNASAAQARLKKLGITRGVRLVATDQSIAALDATVAEVAAQAEASDTIAQWVPGYATSSVAVGVTTDDATLRTRLGILGSEGIDT